MLEGPFKDLLLKLSLVLRFFQNVTLESLYILSKQDMSASAFLKQIFLSVWKLK
jgi:hypothetical protein